uniref:Uncharacterized protein n=1 Tax=uncultured marine virus TaxID=186617 RepID=A0A0F7L919_9VIRU|nr:hypothetical protein [uncultured marine virus]
MVPRGISVDDKAGATVDVGNTKWIPGQSRLQETSQPKGKDVVERFVNIGAL